jgi:predicted secreted protein
MKSKPIFTIIFLIAFTGLINSCKKGRSDPNPSSVEVTGQDNGKTIAISTGESLELTLGNPGDGGYTFDAPQYNSAVLSLKSHTRSLPKASTIDGNFGTDTWEFRPLTTGTTSVTITATRGSDKTSTIVIFTGSIAVN